MLPCYRNTTAHHVLSLTVQRNISSSSFVCTSDALLTRQRRRAAAQVVPLRRGVRFNGKAIREDIGGNPTDEKQWKYGGIGISPEYDQPRRPRLLPGPSEPSFAVRKLRDQAEAVLTKITEFACPIAHTDGEWNKVSVVKHRSLQFLWRTYMRILEKLKESQALDKTNVAVENFTWIYLSLIRYPGDHAENAEMDEKIDQWTTISIPLVMDFLEELNVDPTAYQLGILIKYYSYSNLASALNDHKGLKGDVETEEMVDHVLSTWERRRRLAISAEGIVGKGELDLRIDDMTMRCLDEAVLLPPTLTTHADKLNKGLVYWIDRRDARVGHWAYCIKKLCEEWMEVSAAPAKYPSKVVRADETESTIIRLLILNALLPDRLRADPPMIDIGTRESRKFRPDLNDKFDLIRLILGISIDHQVRAPPAESMDPLEGSLIRIRNVLYDQRRFDELVRLVLILSPQTANLESGSKPHPLPADSLDGIVFASLITAARGPEQLCRLMVPLYRLPVPRTPVPLSNSTRRFLRHFALQASYLRLQHLFGDPQDKPAEIIVSKRGMMGLLDALLDKWKVGLPHQQYDLFIKAEERGNQEMLDKVEELRSHHYKLSDSTPEVLSQDGTSGRHWGEHGLRSRPRRLDRSRRGH